MNVDKFGISHCSSDELCDLLYLNPELDLQNIQVDDPERFNRSIKELYTDHKSLLKYLPYLGSVEDFDQNNQKSWYMPDEYKNLDIAKWILDKCIDEHEMQRVGKELLMYQERGLIDMLKFMKYFVDTMRENNVVWGVGRGSSVASYCLFLIGVHKINSIFYDLEIEEFLR